jgi:hypothetical protein
VLWSPAILPSSSLRRSALKEVLLSDDACLGILLRFADPQREDDAACLASVLAALFTAEGSSTGVDGHEQHSGSCRGERVVLSAATLALWIARSSHPIGAVGAVDGVAPNTDCIMVLSTLAAAASVLAALMRLNLIFSSALCWS